MTDEKAIEAVREALGKPVLPEFSDATSKIRLNLMIVACITIAMIILDVKVAPQNTLLGVTFEGLTTENLKTGLLAINLYMFIHFAWCAMDGLQEWRLRVTGTRVAFITGARFSSPDADHPSDPRQSTLYNWWLAQSARMKRIDEGSTKLQADLTRFVQESRHADFQSGLEPGAPIRSILDGLKSDMQTLTHEVGLAKGVVNSVRIPVSLQRFENAFQLFLRSQNLRWLVVEAGFPLLLGVSSIFLLLNERWS
ncbi:hypothetical protein ABIC94_003395 [Variovorax paradoxus]|uniref:hypothetical protein n=1 Tax=Variovorax paradoxus TaxID=34073 RepID=UPI003393ABD8